MTLPLFGDKSGAAFSDDRTYRYHLWRVWGDPNKRLVIVGVNPSRANESDSDHTITKCCGFGQRWGFGALDMGNLFAYAGPDSTDVMSLLGVADPVGPDTDLHLARIFSGAARIVWAWGKHPPKVRALIRTRALTVKAIARSCETGTFGCNDDGSPRHPLMLSYMTPFVRDP